MSLRFWLFLKQIKCYSGSLKSPQSCACCFHYRYCTGKYNNEHRHGSHATHVLRHMMWRHDGDDTRDNTTVTTRVTTRVTTQRDDTTWQHDVTTRRDDTTVTTRRDDTMWRHDEDDVTWRWRHDVTTRWWWHDVTTQRDNTMVTTRRDNMTWWHDMTQHDDTTVLTRWCWHDVCDNTTVTTQRQPTTVAIVTRYTASASLLHSNVHQLKWKLHSGQRAPTAVWWWLAVCRVWGGRGLRED